MAVQRRQVVTKSVTEVGMELEIEIGIEISSQKSQLGSAVQELRFETKNQS